MTTTAIPAGWSLSSGTWGTDVTIDTTTYLSGGQSLKFESGGALLATIVGDWIPMVATSDESIQTRTYSLNVVHKSDRADPGGEEGTIYYIYYTIQVANADRSSITTYSAGGGPLIDTNWNNSGGLVELPTSGAWMRVAISRSRSIIGLWVDSVELKQMPVGATYVETSGGTFTGSWADTANVSSSEIDYNGFAVLDGSAIYLGAAGLYNVSASIELPGVYAAGDGFAIRLKILYYSDTGSVLRYWYGSTAYYPATYDTPTNENPLGLNVSATFTHTMSGKRYTSITPQVIQYAGTIGSKIYENTWVTVSRSTDR